MPNTTLKVKTTPTVAIEQRLSAAYRVAVTVITASGVLAVALFTIVWKLKV